MLEKTLDAMLLIATVTLWCWIIHRVIYLITL